MVASAPFVLTGGQARAASYADDLVAQLMGMGYTDITVAVTWLGRVKIQAHRDGGIREVVLNPLTGEILRDVWYAGEGGSEGRRLLGDVSSSHSGSGSGSDDDRDDDEDDEEEDDDEDEPDDEEEDDEDDDDEDEVEDEEEDD